MAELTRVGVNETIRQPNLKTNAKKRKKSMPDEYDLDSPYPPTRLQCQGSGPHAVNAVGAFYASPPPPPERTKPHSESMLTRPLFVNLFTLALGELDAELSERETDFFDKEHLKSAPLLFENKGKAYLRI